MYCKNCGRLIESDSNYCENCGQPMTELKEKPNNNPSPSKPINYGLIGLFVSLAGLLFVVIFYFATVGGENFISGYRGSGNFSYGHRMSNETVIIGMILACVFVISGIVLALLGMKHSVPPQRSYIGIITFLSIAILLLAFFLFIWGRPNGLSPM